MSKGLISEAPAASCLDLRFVVELCELVELHSLQIACFELFSSIPKSFNVSVSERSASLLVQECVCVCVCDEKRERESVCV